MTVDRSAASAARRAGSKSASRSTRMPRAPQARAIAAKSTGPRSVPTPTPVPRRSCHIRIVPYCSLSKATTTTRAPTRTAVSSSAMVIPRPPSPTRATTARSRWTSAAAIGGRQAVAHRARGRSEERPGSSEPEAASCPAGEVAGIGGQDRVVGQHPPQRRDRPARVDARTIPWRLRRRRSPLPMPARSAALLACRAANALGIEHGPADEPLVGGAQERLGVGRRRAARQGAHPWPDPARGRREPSAGRLEGPRSRRSSPRSAGSR